MRTEIEIDDNLIKEEIQKQVASSIRAIASSWGLYELCKLRVNEVWNDSIDDMIKAELANTPEIRARIADAIEKKIKLHITSLMKSGIYG